MAKRQTNPFDALNTLLDDVAPPGGGMLDINPIAKIDEWIGTGWYILNAAFSGSIYGGIPNRRSIAFVGDEGTGKTFLAMSALRIAQGLEEPYQGLYFDSEGAIDIEFAERLGIDTSNTRLQPVNTMEQLNHVISKIIEQYDNNIAKGKKNPKLMIVLDSLGNLTTNKEKQDTKEDTGKRDMTKQQEIRKLFRVNGMDLARLGIPFIVTNHVYDAMKLFSPKEISGGMGLKYNASIIFILGKGRMDDTDETKETRKELTKKGVSDKAKLGITIYVNPYKQRFARPIPIKIHIPFYKKPNPYVGLEQFLNWKDFGVIQGNLLSEEDYEDLTPAKKKICAEIETVIKDDKGKETIQKRYVLPDKKAKTLVVRHLEAEIPITDLFTEKVFTPELLKKLDEEVIKPTFQLPDIKSLEELAELEKEILSKEELEDELGEKNKKE